MDALESFFILDTLYKYSKKTMRILQYRDELKPSPYSIVFVLFSSLILVIFLQKCLKALKVHGTAYRLSIKLNLLRAARVLARRTRSYIMLRRWSESRNWWSWKFLHFFHSHKRVSTLKIFLKLKCTPRKFSVNIYHCCH